MATDKEGHKFNLDVSLSLLDRRRKSIKETPLTDEEMKEAILEAKRKKWNRMRHEEYWKKTT